MTKNNKEGSVKKLLIDEKWDGFNQGNQPLGTSFIFFPKCKTVQFPIDLTIYNAFLTGILNFFSAS